MMAACRRTELVWSLLRCCGQRRPPGFGRSPSAAVCGGGEGYVKVTVWRDRHTWVTETAPNLSTMVTWTSQRRSLSSKAPYKDEYPPLPEYTPNQETHTKEVFIIRVKGLPWSCTTEDLVKFFSECQIRGGINGIHLMHNRNGKPNGQAFIELEDEKDIGKALERHRQYLGPRYIEVYEVTNCDAEAILKGTDDRPSEDGVVRIRGLPFNCMEEDVLHFFSGLDVVKDGVTFVLDRRGRNTGDAYVQFANQEMADQALQKDREVIGNRYIEIFPSKKSEIQTQYSRERGEASGTAFHTQKTNSVSMSVHHIHMRGIPYQATAADIINFFSPIRVAKVQIEYGPEGRPRGEAKAYFSSHQDAVAAMSKDKECIANRYIELFLNSPLPARGSENM